MDQFTESERTRLLMRGAASFRRLGHVIGPDAFRRLADDEPRVRGMFGGSARRMREDFISTLGAALTTRADVGRFPKHVITRLDRAADEHRKFGVEPEDYRLLATHLLDAFRTARARTGPGGGPRMAADPAEVRAVRILLAEATAILTSAARRHAETEGPATRTGRVLEVQRRTRDIAVIRVHCPEPIPFRVGQHLPVRSPLARGVWRELSPALPPNPEGLLEFHVRIVDGGKASRPMVAASRPGDEWTFGTPRGTLGDVLDEYRIPLDDGPAPTGRHHLPEPKPRPIFMVAGGTGLAPLRAIALEAADLPAPPPIHLVLGARSPGELYDLRTLTEMNRNLANLTVTTAVEKRDDAPWTNPGPMSSHRGAPMPRLGRAADVAARRWGGAAMAGELARGHVLIAGRGPMIEVTRQRLIAAGADPALVRHDPVT
ncbi:FAD-binding oxidoreductase [uncultured Corynebacterium sp.]|uniref:FAD-binding oxidoreductase n=1 Tax=uncultured Corynebacterium sp. TaxID=159447 RepID=UPI0025CF7C3F|nr:FAD-binding oxidoreductase [uncultured Corynebacterium sp.]